MSEVKTAWRKNLDPRYISGEDLFHELKDLKKSMNVYIERQDDSKAFDQSVQKEVDKTALYLVNIDTKQRVHKPCLLNVTNAKFLEKEFGSIYIEDWYNKPFTMFCMPDKRHGQVVRFKKYYAPAKKDESQELIKQLDSCSTLNELIEKWGSFTFEQKNIPSVLAQKDKLKETLK